MNDVFQLILIAFFGLLIWIYFLIKLLAGISIQKLSAIEKILKTVLPWVSVYSIISALRKLLRSDKKD